MRSALLASLSVLLLQTLALPVVFAQSAPAGGSAPGAPTPADGSSESAPQTGTSTSPAYTLHTATRMVLLDVTVHDRQGHAVPHLPASAFHVEDDRQPVTLAHFEEHGAGEPSAIKSPLAHPPGTFSNEFLLHAPPVLNVFLLDLSNIALRDQLLLALQLEHLIDSLPGDQPIAIYTRTSGVCTVVEPFTADRERLRRAIRRAVPRSFEANARLDDTYALQQMTSAVTQLPGRKNLLWFSGGAAVRYFNPVMLDSEPMVYHKDARVRAVYDGLEAARVAVYPIDARGLNSDRVRGELAQHAMMDEIAAATGGRAVHDSNGLAASAAHILDTDRSFYTLTYSPGNFTADHKWHSLRVHVDDPNLELSYRAGYFSDNPAPPLRPSPPPSPSSSPDRPGALAGVFAGKRNQSLLDDPIVFQAEVLPVGSPLAAPGASEATQVTASATAHHGAVPYAIRYSVPAGSFGVHTVKGKPAIVLNIAAVAFNRDGSDVAHAAQSLTLYINSTQLPILAGVRVPVVQQLALNRGDLSLYLAVWDAETGHMGTLEIPIKVAASRP